MRGKLLPLLGVGILAYAIWQTRKGALTTLAPDPAGSAGTLPAGTSGTEQLAGGVDRSPAERAAAAIDGGVTPPVAWIPPRDGRPGYLVQGGDLASELLQFSLTGDSTLLQPPPPRPFSSGAGLSTEQLRQYAAEREKFFRLPVAATDAPVAPVDRWRDEMLLEYAESRAAALAV